MFRDDGHWVDINPTGVELIMKFGGVSEEEKSIISQKLLAYALRYKEKINSKRNQQRQANNRKKK